MKWPFALGTRSWYHPLSYCKSDFRASLKGRSQEEAPGVHVHNVTDLLLTLEAYQKVVGMISPMTHGETEAQNEGRMGVGRLREWAVKLAWAPGLGGIEV